AAICSLSVMAPPTPALYTLSLHDALPIFAVALAPLASVSRPASPPSARAAFGRTARPGAAAPGIRAGAAARPFGPAVTDHARWDRASITPSYLSPPLSSWHTQALVKRKRLPSGDRTLWASER